MTSGISLLRSAMKDNRRHKKRACSALSRCRNMSSERTDTFTKSFHRRRPFRHSPRSFKGRERAGRARLLRLVFKQAIKSTQRVGVLLFLPSQLVNPSRDGGGGVLRFSLYVAAGCVPALLESPLPPPLSLGELDDSDSRVCAHHRSGRQRDAGASLLPAATTTQ